jgi:CRP/FNR family cyclic AMP-dependent transcriptional regulator
MGTMVVEGDIMTKTTTYAWPKSSNARCGNKLRLTSSSLYGVDIFEGIQSKELHLPFEDMQIQPYPAGTLIFSPEDTCKYLYLLWQGGVELYRLTPEGKRIVTRRITPRSMFGIMGLLGQTVQGSFAETTKDSTIYVISREDILTLLGRRPELVLHILEAVGKRLCLLEERLIEIIDCPVSIRLAHFLITNADPVSGVLNNITHEEIGNIIGAFRQTVTEALSNLRKQGLILTGRKQIHIIDRHGLEEIVGGSESRFAPDFTVF